jgi:hypothetical protein
MFSGCIVIYREFDFQVRAAEHVETGAQPLRSPFAPLSVMSSSAGPHAPFPAAVGDSEAPGQVLGAAPANERLSRDPTPRLNPSPGVASEGSVNDSTDRDDDGDWGTLDDVVLAPIQHRASTPASVPVGAQMKQSVLSTSNLADSRPIAPVSVGTVVPQSQPLASTTNSSVSTASVAADPAASPVSSVPTLTALFGGRKPSPDSAAVSTPDAFRHVTALLTPSQAAGSPSVRTHQEMQRSNDSVVAAMKARETSDRLVLSLEAQVTIDICMGG